MSLTIPEIAETANELGRITHHLGGVEAAKKIWDKMHEGWKGYEFAYHTSPDPKALHAFESGFNRLKPYIGPNYKPQEELITKNKEAADLFFDICEPALKKKSWEANENNWKTANPAARSNSLKIIAQVFESAYGIPQVAGYRVFENSFTAFASFCSPIGSRNYPDSFFAIREDFVTQNRAIKKSLAETLGILAHEAAHAHQTWLMLNPEASPELEPSRQLFRISMDNDRAKRFFDVIGLHAYSFHEQDAIGMDVYTLHQASQRLGASIDRGCFSKHHQNYYQIELPSPLAPALN